MSLSSNLISFYTNKRDIYIYTVESVTFHGEIRRKRDTRETVLTSHSPITS